MNKKWLVDRENLPSVIVEAGDIGPGNHPGEVIFYDKDGMHIAYYTKVISAKILEKENAQ